MSGEGPKRVVVTGGGLAGLVCADALAESLSEQSAESAGERERPILELTVLGDGDVGEPDAPLRADDPVVRELHPLAPQRAPRSRGVLVLPAGDDEARALLERSGARLARSSTCFAWLAPPDVSGGPHAAARLVELRAAASGAASTDEDARSHELVRLLDEGGPLAGWLGQLLERTLGVAPSLRGLVPSLDTLLRSGELSAGFRWGAALLVDLALRATAPDDDEDVRALLGGRAASDVDARELLDAVVRERLLPGFTEAREALRGVPAGELDELMAELRALGGADLDEALVSVLPLVELLANDAEDGLRAPFDPSASSLFELYLGGGHSWPFGLDARTALGWLRRRHGAPASVGAWLVDDADLQASVRALRERVGEREGVTVLDETWSSRVLLFGARASAVEVTDHVERMPALVPTVHAARRGIPTATLEADLVVCAQPPPLLWPLLDDVEHAGMRTLRAGLRSLARDSEEPLTLRLFFPEKLALLPEGDACALHGLVGPFHTVVDLERAFGERALVDVALGGREGERRLYGSALELSGTWASAFWTRDARATPAVVDGKPGWPPAVRELLRRLAEDPEDFEPATVDARAPLTGEDASLPAPMLGEVKGLARTRYLERWIEEAAPVVVTQALLQLASLPGLDERARDTLTEEAERVASDRHPRVRFLLLRGCQAETRTPSFGPGRRRSLATLEGVDEMGLVLASGALLDEPGALSLEAEVLAGKAAARRALALLPR